MYQNIHYIFCLHSILILSITLLLECSEKRNFPNDFLNEKDEEPTEEKFKELFAKTLQEKRKKFVLHQNTFVKTGNREDPKVYYTQTITDPRKPGVTTIKKQKSKKNISKNSFNFSTINTKEKYEAELSKITQEGEDTKVYIQCDYCNHEENHFFWLAAYNIVAHRKTEHSICGCNKSHPTPKDAYDCTDCQ